MVSALARELSKAFFFPSPVLQRCARGSLQQSTGFFNPPLQPSFSPGLRFDRTLIACDAVTQCSMRLFPMWNNASRSLFFFFPFDPADFFSPLPSLPWGGGGFLSDLSPAAFSSVLAGLFFFQNETPRSKGKFSPPPRGTTAATLQADAIRNALPSFNLSSSFFPPLCFFFRSSFSAAHSFLPSAPASSLSRRGISLFSLRAVVFSLSDNSPLSPPPRKPLPRSTSVLDQSFLFLPIGGHDFNRCLATFASRVRCFSRSASVGFLVSLCSLSPTTVLYNFIAVRRSRNNTLR